MFFSTDLSHFFSYDKCRETDSKSIEIIKNLDSSKIKNVDACGINALKIFFELSKIRGFKPKLVHYENSGDVTHEKDDIVFGLVADDWAGCRCRR